MLDIIQTEHIVTIIVAVMASNGFWSFMQHKLAKNDVKSEAILALLHDKLFYLCEKHIELGYISIEDLENIDYLIIPYKKMGGNGTVELLYEKVKKLPHKKPEEVE